MAPNPCHKKNKALKAELERVEKQAKMKKDELEKKKDAVKTFVEVFDETKTLKSATDKKKKTGELLKEMTEHFKMSPNFKCPACHDFFDVDDENKIPKNLDCGHSLCADCVAKKPSFKCRSCTTVTSLRGPKKTDFAFRDFLD